MNNLLPILSLDKGVLVCDSRDIAKALEIDHHNFMQTVYKHQEAIESHFEKVLFQTDASRGKNNAAYQTKYCLLAEDQFIFIATLSRNTVKVVEVKAYLVKAFCNARRALRSPFLTSTQVTQTDKSYLDKVLRQYSDSFSSKIKRSKSIDDMRALESDLNAFLVAYSEILQAHESLQEKESALYLNFCFNES